VRLCRGAIYRYKCQFSKLLRLYQRSRDSEPEFLRFHLKATCPGCPPRTQEGGVWRLEWFGQVTTRANPSPVSRRSKLCRTSQNKQANFFPTQSHDLLLRIRILGAAVSPTVGIHNAYFHAGRFKQLSQFGGKLHWRAWVGRGRTKHLDIVASHVVLISSCESLRWLYCA